MKNELNRTKNKMQISVYRRYLKVHETSSKSNLSPTDTDRTVVTAEMKTKT